MTPLNRNGARWWLLMSVAALVAACNSTPTATPIALPATDTAPAATVQAPVTTPDPASAASALTPAGPAIEPTATNTLLPADTVAPLAVSIVATQLENALDENQERQFALVIRNESSSPVRNISARWYFTPDNDLAPEQYVLANYWDESDAATVSGPLPADGDQYYFTVDYGAAVLDAGDQWGYVGSLHLSNWAPQVVAENDWWFADGLADDPAPALQIPVYIDGVLVSGAEPASS